MGKSKSDIITWLYVGSIAFFTILFFYSILQDKDPWKVTTGVVSPLWSPTSDPVLNFIIDAILIVLGIAIGIGVIISALVLAISLLALALVGSFLLWLASLSTTGTILSVSLVIGTVILIIRHLLKSSQKSRASTDISTLSTYDSGSYYLDSSSNLTSTSEPKTNPMFETSKIDKAILSDDKILRDSSGGKIGKLEKAIFSDDQIIRDSSGKKAGRIEQSTWDKDKQIIKSADGKKEGEIKTDFWGNRIIVDKDGEKIGRIEKNIWGETVIKKK